MESLGTHVSTGALTREAMGYGAMGHVATQEPISEAGRGLELQNVWQRRSPPEQGSEVRSHGKRGNAEAHLSGVAWFGAAGRVAMRRCTPCPLS
jgi:hypothetical protein